MTKKVILRTSENAIHAGYLPLSGFVDLVEAEPGLALLSVSGRLTRFSLAEIRSVAWVTDFNLQDAKDPEGLQRKAFLSRPRTEGLWVRVHLAGGDTMEGLAASDTSLLDSMIIDRGLFLSPPDPRSNTSRLYLPRPSIQSLQVLAVITASGKERLRGARASAAHPSRPDTLQDSLFP